jgi:prepilin-type N-terminal cleavage/methylation domain-containing protein
MNTFKLRTRSMAKRAFTLIEIMVASVIMVILVGLVIQITSEVLNVWNRSSGKLAANAEARIAMDLLTQDLETAVFRNNGQQWLRVEAPLPTAATDKVQTIEQTVGLKLFSPALDRPAGPGDICAIGYRLAHKESYAGGPDVYALYRRVVGPKITFDDYMGSGTTGPQLALDASSTADWLDASITDNSNYLVGNIVEFKIFVYLDDYTGKPENADPLTMQLTNNHTYSYGGTGGLTTPILYADIVLTVVSDEGMRLLENLDKIPEDAADVAREYGEVFTRRVNFQARAL